MEWQDKVEELERKISNLEKEVEEIKGMKKENKRDVDTKVPFFRPTDEFKQPIEEKTEPVDWEKIIAQVWLPKIFIVVLLFGVMWGFKAAFDGGFINETAIVFVGFVFSGALIWLGKRQFENSRDVLGQVLMGASIVTLLLTTFAAHMLYKLLDVYVAFGLNVIWIVMGLYLSNRYGSQTLALVSSLAGILVPFLTNFGDLNVYLFVTYEVLMFASLLYLSIKNDFSALYFSSVFLFQLSMLIMFLVTWGEENKILVVATIIQHLLISATFILAKTNLTKQMSMVFTSFALVYFWMEIGFENEMLKALLLSSVVIYSALTYWLWKNDSDKKSVTLSISVFAIMLYFITSITGDLMQILLLVEGVIALWLGFKIKSNLQIISATLVFSSGMYLSLDTIFVGIEKIMSMNTLNWLVLIIGMLAVSTMFKMNQQTIKQFNGEVISILLNGLNIYFGLVFITTIISTLTMDFSSNAHHLMVSLGWITYAISGIVYGLKLQSKKMRLVGIGLVFLTLMKVVFVDLPEVSVFIRAVLFIGLGIIGVVISRMFYKK